MALSLGGSFSSKKGSSSSTTNASSQSTSTTQRLDDSQLTLINQLVNQLAGNIQGGGPVGYSKQDAISDTQGAIANLFRTYQNTVLPKIYGASSKAGAYNSTSQQLLANDAFAATTAQGAALQQQAISDYAKLGQSQQSLTLQGLQALLGIRLQGLETTDTSSTSTSSTKSSGSSSGFSLGGSLGL